MTTPRRGVRRSAVLVAGFAASLCCSPIAMAAPDEELLGKSRGYPMGTRANWYTDDSVRVGSYTNLDKLFPNQHHVLTRVERPSPLTTVAVAPHFGTASTGASIPSMTISRTSGRPACS
jgi:hypothetical protein